MTALRKIEAHQWERNENDFYVEPEWCSRRLLQEEKFEGDIWDPCCGFGTIVKSAIEEGFAALGTDIVNRGYPSMHMTKDFLKVKASGTVNIVCNPPFNLAREFAEQALKCTTGKIAMIFPTARLNAARWLEEMPLRRVWLMTPRPSMPPGHVIARGEKPGGGKMDFCWFVLEPGYRGKPQLRWLHRDEGDTA